MTLPTTVSWIEIIWTVPATLALVYALWTHRESWHDLRRIKAGNWNGVALVQAKGYFRAASITVVELGVMAALGVLSMTQPPDLSSDGDAPGLLALALTLMFIGLPCLLLVREFGNRRDRAHIRRLVRAEGR